MALKLRISLSMALIASSLTLLVGLHNGIPLMAMTYRVGVSLVLFAILGYVSGQFAERFFQENLVEDVIESQAATIDTVKEEPQQPEDMPAAEFEPLDPKNFENITIMQKQ